MEPWEYLKEFVGSKQPDNDQFIQACWAEAEVLVSDFVGATSVPAEIYTLAIKRTGANLYQSRKAQNAQSAGFVDGQTPVFAAKDPLNSVYPLLQRYVGWF
jgi:hypothetical protein